MYVLPRLFVPFESAFVLTVLSGGQRDELPASAGGATIVLLT